MNDVHRWPLAGGDAVQAGDVGVGVQMRQQRQAVREVNRAVQGVVSIEVK